jgi:hypothetical protein
VTGRQTDRERERDRETRQTDSQRKTEGPVSSYACKLIKAFVRFRRSYKVVHFRTLVFLLYIVSNASLPYPKQGCQIFLGPNIPKWKKYTK